MYVYLSYRKFDYNAKKESVSRINSTNFLNLLFVVCVRDLETRAKSNLFY